MNPKIQQRGWLLATFLMMVGGVVFMVLGALQENIVFFVTPTEWLEKKHSSSFAKIKSLRLGGRVVKGSISKHKNTISFAITDEKNTLNVLYRGPVPDLFREGQGIVAIGAFDEQGTFMAQQILAKHDETYMPKEVVNQLKEQSLWRKGQGKT